MKNTQFLLYENAPAVERLAALVRHLEVWEYHTVHSEKRIMLEVSNDGESIPSSLPELSRKLIEHGEVSWNFYIYDSTNVLTNVTAKGKAVRTVFFPKTLIEIELQRLVACIESLFRHGARAGTTFGFIVDRFAGLHEDFHWDDFFFGNTTPVDEWPEVLGLSAQSEKVSSVPTNYYVREKGPGFALFRKKSDLVSSA